MDRRSLYDVPVPEAARRPIGVETVGRIRTPRRSTFRVEEMAYEGGHQPQEAYEAARRLAPGSRETPRAMYPGELLSLLRRFKHPRYATVGIAATRFGGQVREEFGMAPHGTIFACTQWEREWHDAVPMGCIPWSSIRTACWDERQMRWVGGEIVRGWRSLIHGLVMKRILRPDPYLSWLIGVDTEDLMQQRLAQEREDR